MTKDTPKGWINLEDNSEIFKDQQLHKVENKSDWKDCPFKPEDNRYGCLFAASNKTFVYPNGMESYIMACLERIKKIFKDNTLGVDLDRINGEVTVSTTKRTFDPTVFFRGCDFMQAFVRYVPLEEAMPLLNVNEDGNSHRVSVVQLRVRNKETLLKRRQRLENPAIRELIEALMQCKLYCHGKTVVIIGPCKNIDEAEKVVVKCVHDNIYPVYALRLYQLKQKFINDPSMVGKDWSAELNAVIPKKKNVQTKKPFKVREKKEYNPFPAAPTERKVDKELADGTFHLKYEKRGSRYQPIKDEKKRKHDKANSEENPSKKRKVETTKE